jgi:glycerol-3-phosphate O-acyltransferase
MNKQEELILSYPKLRDRVSDRKSEQEKVLKIIKEIRADVSEAAYASMEKFLDATVGKLYDGVHLNEVPGNNLKELVEQKNVVLVPNHQSHADYIALSYAIWKKYHFPMYVAAGNNLNVFPVGGIFRRCGAFFIRRTFGSDILYKLTLEAYLYYLLYLGRPIEFFFEGGRSRTGKLRSPKFGLFNMILEAHTYLPQDKKRELVFVPVSINHEYVPETRSLAKEAKGAAKQKESTGQLFKLFKIFSYQFGSIHINVGAPFVATHYDDLKKKSQTLAFDCFREVGKKLMVTPSSLLSMILLDETGGALEWEDILSSAWTIISYCEKFNVPFTDSLKMESLEKSLLNAMEMLIGNRKVNVIGDPGKGHVFYSIKEESRLEILYFKNTILHHFLVPWIINAAWIKMFTGQVSDVSELKKLFVEKRDQLKYEFYLPTVKEFLQQSIEVISDSLGRDIKSLDDCMNTTPKDLYAIATNLGIFSRSCHYLVESYYLAVQAVSTLNTEFPQGFKRDQFQKTVKRVHETEKSLGRVVKFAESFSLPVIETGLTLLENKSILKWDGDTCRVLDSEALFNLRKKYEQDLLESLSFNVKIHKI